MLSICFGVSLVVIIIFLAVVLNLIGSVLASPDLNEEYRITIYICLALLILAFLTVLALTIRKYFLQTRQRIKISKFK